MLKKFSLGLERLPDIFNENSAQELKNSTAAQENFAEETSFCCLSDFPYNFKNYLNRGGPSHIVPLKLTLIVRINLVLLFAVFDILNTTLLNSEHS